jgi:hypothetical protein
MKRTKLNINIRTELIQSWKKLTLDKKNAKPVFICGSAWIPILSQKREKKRDINPEL